MRIKSLIIVLSLVIAGCGKNKFTTAPQLQFKSVNTHVLDHNQVIQFKLSLTDKEGDVSGAVMYVTKIVPGCTGSGFVDSTNIPAFPAGADVQADVQVTYANGVNVSDGNGGVIRPILSPQCGKNDTCQFQFVVKDIAGHLSNIAQVDNIVIIN